MSTSNGSTPWPPVGGNDATSGHASSDGPSTEPADQPGLVNEPVQRATVPIKIMIGALIALLITVGGVAFLTTRTTGSVTPTQTPMAPEPTGAPMLPLQAGDYVREPGDATAPPDFGVDRSIQTSYAEYLRSGEPALIVIGARPVDDPKALFDQIKVRAQRQISDGWCGREDSNDLDTCILKRNRTAIITIGLRDQTAEELMLANQLILAETR